MLPSQQQFRSQMKELDIRKNDIIVVYDKLNNMSAMRVYWQFLVFGAPTVRILNGSFSKWKNEGRPTENGDAPSAWFHNRPIQEDSDEYDYILDWDQVVDFEYISRLTAQKLKDKDLYAPILDARGKDSWTKGNIPTSTPLDYRAVLNDDNTFKTKEELIEIFKQAGVHDPENDKVVIYCQRAVTTLGLAAALRILKNDNYKIYDGSYAEYSMKMHE